MEFVPEDVVEMAIDVKRRFNDQFISAWEAGDGMRAGILMCELAATAIWEERQRADKNLKQQES